MTVWRIEVAPHRFVERATLTEPIITIPITLYGYGNGDDAEEGVPRDGAMGGSMGSTSATMPVAVAVPLGLEVLALLGTPHPLSDPQDLGERRSRTRTRRSPS
jgi:hypothetical protein